MKPGDGPSDASNTGARTGDEPRDRAAAGLAVNAQTKRLLRVGSPLSIPVEAVAEDRVLDGDEIMDSDRVERDLEAVVAGGDHP